MNEQTRREREKAHSQHGDLLGQGWWRARSTDLGFDIRLTNLHIRAWFDLWREAEGNPSLSLRQESGAESKAWEALHERLQN